MTSAEYMRYVEMIEALNVNPMEKAKLQTRLIMTQAAEAGEKFTQESLKAEIRNLQRRGED